MKSALFKKANRSTGIKDFRLKMYTKIYTAVPLNIWNVSF